MPYALWIVRGFFYVPQSYEIKIKGYETSGAYGLSSLSEKSVSPFADFITKATLPPQLFKDPECRSGRGFWTHDLPHSTPMLNQLSEPVGGLSSSQDNICFFLSCNRISQLRSLSVGLN